MQVDGLLGEDLLARRRGVHQHLKVRRRRRADDDCVDVIRGQEVAIVRVGTWMA
jgi:hypothetical protein